LATASSESIFASFSSSEAPPLVISGTPVCVCVTDGSERKKVPSAGQRVGSLDRRERTLPTDIGD
jgi:hypothetical protein